MADTFIHLHQIISTANPRSHPPALGAAARAGAALISHKLSAQALLLVDENRRVFSGVEPLMIWKFDTRHLTGIIPVANAQDIAVLETFLTPRSIAEAFAEFTKAPEVIECSTAVENAITADFVLQGVMLSSQAAPLTWVTQVVHLHFDHVRLLGLQTPIILHVLGPTFLFTDPPCRYSKLC